MEGIQGFGKIHYASNARIGPPYMGVHVVGPKQALSEAVQIGSASPSKIRFQNEKTSVRRCAAVDVAYTAKAQVLYMSPEAQTDVGEVFDVVGGGHFWRRAHTCPGIVDTTLVANISNPHGGIRDFDLHTRQTGKADILLHNELCGKVQPFPNRIGLGVQFLRILALCADDGVAIAVRAAVHLYDHRFDDGAKLRNRWTELGSIAEPSRYSIQAQALRRLPEAALGVNTIASFQNAWTRVLTIISDVEFKCVSEIEGGNIEAKTEKTCTLRR